MDVVNIPMKVAAWSARATADTTDTTVNWAYASMDAFARQIAGKLGGRAMGGPVRALTPYIVGENGPEVFTPESAGTVYSNAESRRLRSSGGDGGPATTTVVASAPSRITIQLDPHTTRLLLSGRAVNSSTRAGVGV